MYDLAIDFKLCFKRRERNIMRCMHTKLPDFVAKMQAAAKRIRPETKITIKGMENIETAKVASLRCGRIEEEIYEVTQDPDITEVELRIVPFNPEIIYSSIAKGYDKNGKCKIAILDDLAADIPTVEYYLTDAEVIDDRRSAGHKQTQL